MGRCTFRSGLETEIWIVAKVASVLTSLSPSPPFSRSPHIPAPSVPPAIRTQHPFAKTSQLQVGILEGFFHLLIELLFFALEQDSGAAVQDALRGTLHHQQVAVIIGVLCLVDGELRKAGKKCLGQTSIISTCTECDLETSPRNRYWD